MQTTDTTVQPHPLVARRAAEWQATADRHGVKVTIKPMSPDGYPDGLIVAFETGLPDEFGHALIYPPRAGMRPGRRIRQTLMISEYCKRRGGSIRFGSRDLTRAQFIGRLVEDWARRAARRELVAA